MTDAFKRPAGELCFECACPAKDAATKTLAISKVPKISSLALA